MNGTRLMRHGRLSLGAVAVVVALAAAIATPGAAAVVSVRYATYDVPGYVGSTSLNGINNDGDLAGSLIDASGGSHGFVSRNQAVTIFDYPGTSGVTIVSGLNNSDAVVGQYTDAGGVTHSFVLSPQGAFTAIDVPGAGTASGLGTFANGINDVGIVTGFYDDSANVRHGFQDKNGVFTFIDAPGAGTAPGQGTRLADTTDSGVATGFYSGSSNVLHSFIDDHGNFTTFDAPGAGCTHRGRCGTVASATSENRSTTAGFFFDSVGVHGFVRIGGQIYAAGRSGCATRQHAHAKYGSPGQRDRRRHLRQLGRRARVHRILLNS